MGEFLALLTALLWAIGVIFFKRSVTHIAPFAMNLFKNSLAFILLSATAFVLGQTHTLSIPTRDLVIILLSGAIGIGVSDTFLLMTLKRLGASRTAVVDCLYSPFVIIFSVLLLNESLPATVFLGGALIIGSIIVSSRQGFGGSLPRRQLYIGYATATIAMATVSLAIVIVKPLLQTYPLAWMSAMRMAGGIALLLVMLPFHPDRQSVYAVFRPQPAWKWLLPGTVFGSYLSLVCWLAGFKYAQAGTVALLNQTATVLITILAAVFLQEPLTRLKLLAVGMAFAGAAAIIFL